MRTMVRLVSCTAQRLADTTSNSGIPEDVKSNLRKPLSGTLQITIKSARDLAHALQPKKSKHPSETVIYVKVEDTPRARTHPTRSDRWNEDFEIQVDKANEVEVTIYDKIPGDSAPVPIGMLWLRLSDIVEELRRRKMGAEAGPGWVTAARVNSHQSGSQGGGSGGSGGSVGAIDLAALGGAGAGEVSGPNGAEGVDAWFAIEPEGALFLQLNFGESLSHSRRNEADERLYPQSNRMCESVRTMPEDSVVKVPSEREKKRSTSRTVTNSSRSNSTPSFSALSAVNSCSRARECSARIASTLVTRIAIRKSSRNVSRNLTPNPSVVPSSCLGDLILTSMTTGQGRREDQSSNSSSFRTDHEHFSELVLSLRNGAAARSEECSKVFR